MPENNLVPSYQQAAETIGDAFTDAYYERKQTAGYVGILPLEIKEWTIRLVEGKKVIALVVSGPQYGNPYKNWMGFSTPNPFCDKVTYPQVSGLDTADEMARVLRLGEVLDWRVFPFGPSEYKLPGGGINRGSIGEDVGVYDKKIAEWAKAWALELVDKHIARTHPDFQEAQNRMTLAYEKLFELEHMLRAWIEQTLTKEHGSNWWDKASIDPKIKELVVKNQADKRGFYLDDYGTSILRFTEFPNLRAIIFGNESRFLDVLGTSNWFKRCLDGLEPQRNRIGHMNTLSQDDMQDFLRDANRIIEAIRPYVQIR